MDLLDEILSEWKQDSQYDKHNLGEESLNTASLHYKYLELQTRLRRSITKKEQALKTLKMKKKLWFSGKMTHTEIENLGWEYDPFGGLSKPIKSEMDSYVEVDPDIQNLVIEIEDLRNCYDAVLDIMHSIKWRNREIDTAIAWEKFQAGVY